MAILNELGYHKLGFAYKGQEKLARYVVETWESKEKRQTEEPLFVKTFEVEKNEINFDTFDYCMYNYDKSKENCTDDFAKAVYQVIKLKGYTGKDV